MANSVSYTVSGLDDILAKLKTVTHDVRYKGGRASLRKGAQVVLDQARTNASRVDDPKTPEEIAANLVMRWSPNRFKRTGDLMFRVGVLGGARRASAKEALKSARRRTRLGKISLAQLGEVAGKGKGNPGGDTYYWRYLEFGTASARAQPFMRPAMTQVGQQPLDTFAKEYNKALDRAIKRQMRKGSARR